MYTPAACAATRPAPRPRAALRAKAPAGPGLVVTHIWAPPAAALCAAVNLLTCPWLAGFGGAPCWRSKYTGRQSMCLPAVGVHVASPPEAFAGGWYRRVCRAAATAWGRPNSSLIARSNASTAGKQQLQRVRTPLCLDVHKDRSAGVSLTEFGVRSYSITSVRTAFTQR